MPLTALREQEEADRRKRFGQYIVIALLIVLATTGLQIWLIGHVQSQVDRTQEQVTSLQNAQTEFRVTQKAGVLRGLRIRAIGCRTIELLGGTFGPGDDCLSPELQPYFTPSR